MSPLNTSNAETHKTETKQNTEAIFLSCDLITCFWGATSCLGDVSDLSILTMIVLSLPSSGAYFFLSFVDLCVRLCVGRCVRACVDGSWVRAFVREWVRAFMRAWLGASVRSWVRARVGGCACVCVRVCVCVCVCVLSEESFQQHNLLFISSHTVAL